MHGDSADGIINAQPLQKLDSEDDQHARDPAEEDRTRRADPVAWARDGDESGEEAVDGEAHVPLLALDVGVGHRGQARRARGERRVGGDATDALEVHRRERAAGIEAVPAEPEDQATYRGDHQIVRQHRGAAIALEPAAEARAQRDGSGESDEAADGMDDRRSGKVMKAGAHPRQEVAVAAHRREEAVRPPGPVADDGVDEAGDGDAVEQVADEARATDHRAGGDGRAGVGEGELEEPEG